MSETGVLGLFCGANKFADAPGAGLNGCVRDQRTLWDMFGRSAEYKLLLDSEFTRARWKEEITNILHLARRQGKVVWLSFSSHGTSTARGEAVCCYDMMDGGLVYDWEIQGIIHALPPGSMIFADTCYSGSMVTPGSWSGFAPVPAGRGVGVRARYYEIPGVSNSAISRSRGVPVVLQEDKDSRLWGRACFGSCQDWETAGDTTSSDGGSYGIGTWGLSMAWKAGHTRVGALAMGSAMAIKTRYGAMQTPTVTCGNFDWDLKDILAGKYPELEG